MVVNNCIKEEMGVVVWGLFKWIYKVFCFIFKVIVILNEELNRKEVERLCICYIVVGCNEVIVVCVRMKCCNILFCIIIINDYIKFIVVIFLIVIIGVWELWL